MSHSKERLHWILSALDLSTEEVTSLETVLQSIKKEDTKKLSLFWLTLIFLKVICISFLHIFGHYLWKICLSA